MLTGQPKNLFAPIGGRPVKLGLCVPKTCTSNDITLLTDHILSSTLTDKLFIQKLHCDEHFGESSKQFNKLLLATLFFLVTLIAASTSATILDLPDGRKSKLNWKARSKLGWFIEVFSLTRGYKKLISARKLSHSMQFDMRVLDGLKVLSMLWIIVIHSYNFGFQWLLFDNMVRVDNVYKGAWIQWIANGTFSLDNFFLISGFLSWFKCLNVIGGLNRERKASIRKEFNCGESSSSSSSKNSINDETLRKGSSITLQQLILSIITRYLRLAPTMMFLILISVVIVPRLGWGPSWSDGSVMFEDWCHSNWFINLAMLQNFINTPNMCFSHSWYSAVNFQLFIFINIIMLALNYACKIENLAKLTLYTKWILISAIIVAQISVAALVYHLSLPAAPLVPVESLNSMLSYYGLVYIKPYYWLSSYSIGCLLAISIVSLKPSREAPSSREAPKLRMPSQRLIQITQVISVCALVSLIMSLLPYFRGAYKMSETLSSLHALLARPLWSICLAFILFGALQTKANSRKSVILKMIHALLSWNLWLPLSKLTYSAYLFHPLVMFMFYGSRVETFQFSHSLILYFTLGNIVLTYIGSTLIYLTIELPVQLFIEQTKSLFLLHFKQTLSSTGTRSTAVERSDFLALSTQRPR